MKTATVREVRLHLRKILAWVENGEEVLVTRRNKTVARLVPFGPSSLASVPDFAARARAIWGSPSKETGLSNAILTERDERS